MSKLLKMFKELLHENRSVGQPIALRSLGQIVGRTSVGHRTIAVINDNESFHIKSYSYESCTVCLIFSFKLSIVVIPNEININRQQC